MSPLGNPKPHIVPLVCRQQDSEMRQWITSIKDTLGSGYRIDFLENLTALEREGVEVALTADPNPTDLAALPKLRWLQSLWAGVERLVADLPPNGPAIVRMVDPQMAETMSEAVLAWTLYLHRDMPVYAAQQQQKIWRQHVLKQPHQRTVAVLGLGKLGGAAALRLKANGFRVLGWSRDPKDGNTYETLSGPDGLNSVLTRAEIVVVLMPLTPDTHGLIDKAKLSLLPSGAKLINFARGPIIDDTALLEALDEGQVSHAVLDVFSVEPLPEASPFWAHPSVTILPHISAPTIQSTAAKIAAENIARYFQTGALPDAVNKSRGY